MIFLLFALLPSLAAGQTCCNKKEVLGSTADSGTYWLDANNDTRCTDGCAYSKDGGSADSLYCFSGNKYVLNCSSEEKTVWMTQATIIPTSLTNKGEFGEFEYCANEHYAVGFDLQYAPLCSRRCTKDDDVALMAIRLYCAKYDDTATIVGTVTSDVTSGYARKFGGTSAGIKWTTTQNCASGKFLHDTQYLSEHFEENTNEQTGATCPDGIKCSTSYSDVNDPVGGMNLNTNCTDGTTLNGAALAQTEKADTATWSAWQGCETGFAICGLASKIYLSSEDNFHSLGHTGVSFACCQLPEGFGR